MAGTGISKAPVCPAHPLLQEVPHPPRREDDGFGPLERLRSIDLQHGADYAFCYEAVHYFPEVPHPIQRLHDDILGLRELRRTMPTVSKDDARMLTTIVSFQGTCLREKVSRLACVSHTFANTLWRPPL